MKSVRHEVRRSQSSDQWESQHFYPKGYLTVSISFIAIAGIGEDKEFDCVYEEETFKSLVELISTSPLKVDANFKID